MRGLCMTDSSVIRGDAKFSYGQFSEICKYFLVARNFLHWNTTFSRSTGDQTLNCVCCRPENVSSSLGFVKSMARRAAPKKKRPRSAIAVNLSA